MVPQKQEITLLDLYARLVKCETKLNMIKIGTPLVIALRDILIRLIK